MSHINIEEIKSMKELARELTSANVHLLQEILSIPSAIVEITGTNALNFLNALKFEIKEFNPSKFIKALETIQRPELIPLTRKIAWLNVGSAKAKYFSTPFESFVTMLKEEVESAQWKLIIGTVLSDKVSSEVDFDTAFKLCIEGDLIKPDVGILCEVMIAVDRHDIVQNILKYSNVFKGMDEVEFKTKLIDELECDEKADHEIWSNALRVYGKQQNKEVSILLDEEENVSLEHVYTPLTVVKEELANLKVGEDTTLNEIAFLKSMSDNVKKLETVDFISLVSSLDSNEPEILILIGNPGSGKTFICKYLALLYGTYRLSNFKYVLSVSGRNEEWHQMEKMRQENELEIEKEFIKKWLSIAMPMSINWSKSLVKHFTETKGENLLLIIDGADESVKDVPFKTTLLYLLLQKRILNRATILLTSRTAAWNEIREEHGQELRVDSNFQVLGFSPTDRDSYFKKRINTVAKLNDTKELFFRHDEINQLSLVPVNASLFTSLFNATNNILSQTLTHLYSALILYIVRRQLSHIGLKKLTRVERVSQFHPSVLDCIGYIGEEAYEGIYHRELSCREEDITIRVDTSEYKTERLGLMRVQVKLLKLGHRVNVWTFAHLTLQEYMAAVYLSNKTWAMQCVMIRFIVSTEAVFAMYKMIVRFLCGLLSDRAACLIPIICRNIIPDTMSLIGFPMVHKLGYIKNLIAVSDWSQFTWLYLFICTIIIETNSRLMEQYFLYFIAQLPEHVFFYFNDSISPNEFHCFILSLNYFCQIEILFIETYLINPLQFKSLLHQLSSCSLGYLAIVFYGNDPETIYSYTNLLMSTDRPINFKISITLVRCDLPDSQRFTPLLTLRNQLTGSLCLIQSKISDEIFTHLINQFNCIEYLYFVPEANSSNWSSLQALISNNSQINGLYIVDPMSYLHVMPRILNELSSLQELLWFKEEAYSTLPFLLNKDSLSYVKLFSSRKLTYREHSKDILVKILNNNFSNLRELYLVKLHRIGFNSWTSILTPIQACRNLVSLKLLSSSFTSDDIGYWDTAILYLQSLVELFLSGIPLRDTGLMTLIKSLNRHPAIRSLIFSKCKLTSDSCEPIMMLIHTLPYLRLLKLYEPELSLPDSNPLQLLQHTAQLFSVKLEFF